ncbi:hypothetical protein [Mycoplasma simbae]|uniref:hypothetical protein n=1 Tax=Mycoplasma simbae TaxID=36744 RepID=UPI0004954565|nr:hypothetical protein [Mycoplasma simbae]
MENSTKSYQYHKNGKIMSEVSYVKSAKHGIARTFYINGNICHEQMWWNNKKHGEEKLFKPGGQLRYLAKWENGTMKEKQWY